MVTKIEQNYINMHPKSAEKYSHALNLFPNGVTHDARNLKPFPYYITHAKGSYKWDVDGNRIIDYRTGHGSLILGHSHPDIVAAVTEQIGAGTHFSASTDLELRWGQWVRDLVPCSEKVRFHSSGTEATMMALRMVRAFTGKTKVIKFEDHFHGWSDPLMAGGSGLGGIPEETLSTIIVLPPNDISVVEQAIKENDVAAVILEPTGSHMGDGVILPNFLQQLREVTELNDVVLIFDEVVTGFRIAKGGAQQYYDVTPDMSTHAKILGGGLPGGAVTGKSEIIDMIQLRDDPEYNQSSRVGHNGTFNANPISAAAGSKALELVSNTPVVETANAMGQLLKDGINDLLTRIEVPGCASGIGSLIFLRLGVDHECDKEVCHMSSRDYKKTKDPAINHQLELAMYNNGVDTSGRFIMMSTHSQLDIDQTLEALETSLIDIRAEGLV